MTEKEKEDYLHYLGGFFDGEGCFTVAIMVKKIKNRKCLNIHPHATVTQRLDRREVLDNIVNNLGIGRVYIKGSTACGMWQPTSRSESKKFAEIIQPYIRLKTKQVKLFIEMIDILNSCPRLGVNKYGGDRCLTKEAAIKLAHIADEINRDPWTKKRTNGRSLEELLALIEEIYNQEQIAPKQKIINCGVCNKEFSRYLSNISDTNNFCSRECMGAYSSSLFEKKYMKTLICGNIECKKEFQRRSSDIKSESVFCSNNCHNANQRSLGRHKPSSQRSLKFVEELKAIQNTSSSDKIVPNED